MGPPIVEHLKKFEKRTFVVAVPLLRYSFKPRSQNVFVDFFLKTANPPIERVDPAYSFVDEGPGAQTASRHVTEIPFLSVETEPVIDHQGFVMKLTLLTEINALAVVCVAQPFIKDKHAHEI